MTTKEESEKIYNEAWCIKNEKYGGLRQKERELTKKEKEWIDKFKKLCKKMPKTIMLFAGSGGIAICDAEEYSHYDEIEYFQPIISVEVNAEGGDPWK